MDSGNSSCSLQSSASGGGDDEEYDSRPRPPPPSLHLQHDHHRQASVNFLNPFSNQQHLHHPNDNNNSLLLSHHHPTSLFDPSQNFFHPFSNHQSSPSPENPSHHSSTFLELDMVPSSSSHYHHHNHQFPRSDHHHQTTTLPASSAMLAQPSSSPSSSLPHATELRPTPAISTSNNNKQQRSSSHGAAATRNPKKRTRASRRAPTTVLTTDTSNFRAMVQEFTGIPAPPFSAASPYSRFDLFGSSSKSSAGFTHLDSLYPLRPSAHKLHRPPLSSSFVSHPSNSNSNIPNIPSAGNYQMASSAHQNMMMNPMLSLLQSPADLHQSLKSQSGGGLIGAAAASLGDDQLGTLNHAGEWTDGVSQANDEDVSNRDQEVANNKNNVIMGNYDELQKANFSAATEFMLHHQGHERKGLENVTVSSSSRGEAQEG